MITNVPIHAITARTRKTPAAWLICTVVSLHVTFFGNALWIFSAQGSEAGLGAWMGSAGGVGLCLAAVLRLVSGNRLGANLMRWFFASALIVLGMVINSLLRDPIADPLYFTLNVLPWAALCLIPVLGWPQVDERILRTFRLHLVIGVVGCAAVLIFNRDLLLAESVARSEGLELKQTQYLLYPVQFFFFRYALEGRLIRTVTLAGLTQILIIAVISGSRQPIGVLVLTIMIGFWALVRSRVGRGNWRLGFRKIRTVGLIVAVSAGAVVLVRDQMVGGYELLMQRFTVDEGRSSLAENARWAEIGQLIDQFGLADYAIGRGIVGTFENRAAPKQDNVHIGYFRCLLKGGIPLMLLVICGPLLLGTRLMLKARDPRLLAAAATCVYFAMKNATGNIILPFPFFYITMFGFGEALAWRRAAQTAKASVQPRLQPLAVHRGLVQSSAGRTA